MAERNGFYDYCEDCGAWARVGWRRFNCWFRAWLCDDCAPAGARR